MKRRRRGRAEGIMPRLKVNRRRGAKRHDKREESKISESGKRNSTLKSFSFATDTFCENYEKYILNHFKKIMGKLKNSSLVTSYRREQR